MKSILVKGPRKMHVVERPEPNPEPGEVLVKVQYAGICGSDRHIYHGSHPFVTFPRVIGHEFAGQIVSVGEDVPARRVGERVVVNPVISCGSCFPCTIGRPNVCTKLQVVGVHRDGGWSEYCCVPETLAYALPEGVDDRAAATVEPFSVAANMLSRTSAMKEDTALVYGAGPIGLTVLQVLKGVYRVHRLIAVDRIDERLRWAKESGADLVFNTVSQSLKEALQDADLVPSLIIDAAGHPSILEEAIDLASPAARIGMMGFSPDLSQVSQRKLNAKELTLYASRLNNLQFPNVIDWMEKGLIQPSKFISHSFRFTDVDKAFSLLEDSPVECCKILLDFN